MLHPEEYEIRGHVGVEWDDGQLYVAVALEAIGELTLDADNARLLAQQLEAWCVEIRAMAARVEQEQAKGLPS
jgi:hypothetical protein